MDGVHNEGCYEMLKPDASDCDYPANSWVWDAYTLASSQINPVQKSLLESRIMLIEVFENDKSVEVEVGSLNRLEKIFIP